MRVLGFMTGTSLDAVDMAVLETDGETIEGFGPAGERKLSEATRTLALDTIREALVWPRGAPQPAIFKACAQAVAEEHYAAAQGFLADNHLSWDEIDLLGIQGQTVLHERPKDGVPGRTVQLANADWLAAATGVPVAYDFRSADVAAGGQGAPIAPVYHLARARASGLEGPLAVLNLGGLANITYLPGGDDLVAFDTGPANGLIDLLVQARGAGRFDDGGRLAAAGRVDQAALLGLLDHPYFSAPAPKSLDRYDIPLTAVDGLSLEDAAATLTAFTAETVRLGLVLIDAAPTEVIVCGGGRRNPQIMTALAERLPMPVVTAEMRGWRGDAIEAEAFAYLAARCVRGLPITFPTTTGAPEPMTGGRIVKP